jgi:DnaJ-class molecular chaperone
MSRARKAKPAPKPAAKRYRCPECNGTGEIQMESDDDDGAAEIVECPVCNGTGDDPPATP